MKTQRLSAIAAILSISLLVSCKKNASEFTSSAEEAIISSNANHSSARQSIHSTTGTPDAYSINLDSHTDLGNGNWEWIWSIQNLNPGDGTNNTVQDMSHWGIEFGTCVNSSNLVAASYSTNGTNWSSFTPTIAVDPSQGCVAVPVFKFNFGTNGSATSYYRLVVNQNYNIGYCQGYYKSGRTTGCNTFSFTGIGCLNDIPVE